MQNQRVATSKTIVDFSSSWLLTGSQEIIKHFHVCHILEDNMVKRNDTQSICILYVCQKSLLLSSVLLNDMNSVLYIVTLTAMQLQNWHLWRSLFARFRSLSRCTSTKTHSCSAMSDHLHAGAIN